MHLDKNKSAKKPNRVKYRHIYLQSMPLIHLNATLWHCQQNPENLQHHPHVKSSHAGFGSIQQLFQLSHTIKLFIYSA